MQLVYLTAAALKVADDPTSGVDGWLPPHPAPSSAAIPSAAQIMGDRNARAGLRRATRRVRELRDGIVAAADDGENHWHATVGHFMYTTSYLGE